MHFWEFEHYHPKAFITKLVFLFTFSGEISTREPLDRELRELYDLVVEARDQGTPVRSARVPVRVHVTDVNDNAPEIADPQEDVVSVREEQPPGTEVVRIRAIDRDHGQNASITYSIVKGRDSDGHGLFSIDPSSGVIRTRVVLDHEERSIYRLGVAASDGGSPPRETVRMLRVEVLDLNDNRPTFTSSSLVFRVSARFMRGSLRDGMAWAGMVRRWGQKVGFLENFCLFDASSFTRPFFPAIVSSAFVAFSSFLAFSQVPLPCRLCCGG